MSDNTSPLLAATTQTDDTIPHVLLNTSIGSPTTPRHDHHKLFSSRVRDSTRRDSQTADDPYNINNNNQRGSQDVVPFYRHPKFISFLQIFTMNFVFPFINGVMLGFGEICANELAFRMGWFGIRNLPSTSRRNVIPLGPKGKYGTGIGEIRTKRTKSADGKEIIEEESTEMVYAQMAPAGPIV
ncbi:outer membrane protein TOM13-domain-containing protein [Glomus cerebriforme]|uniref:Outer membrane protein TOM13-domain-containing protein n=1 Tax=Glomus cerebriforme TaxID=658196 RepID=A0A397T275_9GLOM|nr:outer membrane protein TOM13-domain-containing protein [Glomus cerebriforme]